VNQYAKRFAWWFLALATVAGLYLAAEKVGVGRWFLGVTLASLVLAAIPIFSGWFLKLRRYPSVMAESEQLRQNVTKLEEEITVLRQELALEYRRGVAEGQMQVIGSELASQCKKMPRLIAISNENDTLALIGTIDDDANLFIGARFEVQVQATGERKGVVEVVDIRPESNTTTMLCVDATVLAFWDSLRQRAPADPSPPAGMHLTPYVAELAAESLGLIITAAG
jgi:hypothetical protein